MDSHETEITSVLKARYQETENADSVLVTVCVFDLLNSVGVSFFKLRQFPVNKLPHQEFPFPVDVDTVCAVLR
jgi:hypothetical protein